jgi:AraC family transcriptional regulator
VRRRSGAQEHNYRLTDPNGEIVFALTRFRSHSGAVSPVPILPMTDAFLVWIPLAPTATGQCHARYDGREVGIAKAFATTVFDLKRSVELRVRGPFDYLQYYLAGSLLKRVALENDVPAKYWLRDSFCNEDLVVAQLTRSILSANGSVGTFVLNEIALLLGAHILQRYCDPATPARPVRPGLRNWQRIRAEEILRAHVSGNITLRELAMACSLSERQFSRSFRRSFGLAAHQYLIRLRLEQAKTLLAQSRKSLAEVAQLCGFCDQPAFTRAFSRVERMTPSRWRRLNGCRR